MVHNPFNFVRKRTTNILESKKRSTILLTFLRKVKPGQQKDRKQSSLPMFNSKLPILFEMRFQKTKNYSPKKRFEKKRMKTIHWDRQSQNFIKKHIQIGTRNWYLWETKIKGIGNKQRHSCLMEVEKRGDLKNIKFLNIFFQILDQHFFDFGPKSSILDQTPILTEPR